jgi:lantibiotic modifying enzyme
VTWSDTTGGLKAKVGFAHGRTGIAWALANDANARGDKRYLPLVLEALASERAALLDPSGTDEWRSPKWCNGMTGLGLGLLLMSKLDRSLVRLAEVKSTIGGVLGAKTMGNHSLCHGECGALDLLVLASDHVKLRGLRRAVSTRSERIISDIRNSGFVSGEIDGFEVPGLMNGLAGVGLQMLRLTSPGTVPSVLALASPPL